MAMTLDPIKRHRENCRETRGHMPSYFDGDLDPSTEAGMRRHMAACPNCGRMFANISRTMAGLRSLGRTPMPDQQPQGRP